MRAFWNDPVLVSKTPLVTVVLLEFGNLSQLYRMWQERTSAGQSLWAWVSVGIALCLFLNFYRVVCPEQKFAFWSTAVGIALNTCVWLTVLYFRYGVSA